MITQSDLRGKKSHRVEAAIPSNELGDYLAALDGWDLSGHQILKVFSFKNFYETMAFVNAVAYLAHAEDHHPDLEIGYNRCLIKFSTHSVDGLSENDFICAAKVDALGRMPAPSH